MEQWSIRAQDVAAAGEEGKDIAGEGVADGIQHHAQVPPPYQASEESPHPAYGPLAEVLLEQEQFIHVRVVKHHFLELVLHQHADARMRKPFAECTEHRRGKDEIAQHIVLTDDEDPSY
jgi:hypothetical protein